MGGREVWLVRGGEVDGYGRYVRYVRYVCMRVILEYAAHIPRALEGCMRIAYIRMLSHHVESFFFSSPRFALGYW